MNDDMPRDPWAEEGVDPWILEQAENLVHDDAEGHRWIGLDDGPTLDEFEQAEVELTNAHEHLDHTGKVSAFFVIKAAVVALITLAVIISLVLVYGFRG